jgi:putative lipoprotein (rSAM/lipoprotein system)
MKTSRIITGLLALLGFSGCNIENDGPDMYGPPSVVMYGVPEAQFVAKGAVTDGEDKPIENIRVVLKIKDDEGHSYREGYRDTVYTDSKGEFRTDLRPVTEWPIELIAADIDGAENGGEFKEMTKEFAAEEGEWNDQEEVFVKQVDFTLTAKEDENEGE